MKRGGDAVGEQLRLGIAQREAGREVHAGPRLQLPFEGVAVQVDDTRQNEQAGCVEAPARAVAVDQTVSDRNVSLHQPVGAQ